MDPIHKSQKMRTDSTTKLRNPLVSTETYWGLTTTPIGYRRMISAPSKSRLHKNSMCVFLAFLCVWVLYCRFNALGRPLLSNAFVPDAKMSLPENIPAPNSKHPAKKQAIKHTSSTAAVSSSPSVQSSVTLSSSVSAAAPPILASTVAVNGGSSKVSSTSNHPVPAGASSDTPSTLTEVQIEDGESSGEEEVLEEGW